MAEYIEREAALKAVSENDCEGYATWAVKAIPAADVVPAKGLTEEAKDLVRLMPYAVNALAEKLIEGLEKKILEG